MPRATLQITVALERDPSPLGEHASAVRALLDEPLADELSRGQALRFGEFADAIGAIYSAQDAFHAKIAALIETYQTKCGSLKQPA